MPPTLTPTSLQIPQSSLISPGSFIELPDFAAKVDELVSLFNPDEKEKLSQVQNEIQKQKTHLTTLIEELKESQKDYDFSDYEDRLLLSDSEIENILETEIFRKKDGEFTELGKSFFEYLELLTEGKSEELKRKMKKKLIKELKLEDRVYESDGNVEGGKIPTENFYVESKEKFFGYVETAGISGIRSLDIGGNALLNKLEFEDFLTLLKQMRISGIRSLDIGGNGLFQVFEAQDFVSFIIQAGKSGIRNLGIGGNSLSKILDAQDFLNLVSQGGLSGIRSLKISGNGFSEKLEALYTIELLKQAGESGIKSLDISFKSLSNKFSPIQKQELNTITKQYNMQLKY